MKWEGRRAWRAGDRKEEGREEDGEDRNTVLFAGPSTALLYRRCIASTELRVFNSAASLSRVRLPCGPPRSSCRCKLA